MTLSPLVTLVTPAYNHGAFIARTVESVLAQDYPEIEYLVLDDGSTDNTETVMRPYLERLSYRKRVNMGQARTLNAGWAMARGTILGYLSSDDVLHPNAISEVVRHLQEHADTAMAFPDFEIIDPHDRVLKKYVSGEFDYEYMVTRMDCRIGPGALFRKENFDSMGGWDPAFRLIGDMEFWFRLGLQGRIVNLPKALARFRMHPGSTTFGNVRVEVSGEYERLASGYLARPDLPPKLRALGSSILASALVCDARTHLRGGRLMEAFRRVRRAFALPGNRLPWMSTSLILLKAWIGRSVHRLRWSLRNLLSPR